MLQPYLLRSLPAFDSTILVVSQLGDFQFLDLRGLVTPSSMVVSHVNIGAEGGLIFLAPLSRGVGGVDFQAGRGACLTLPPRSGQTFDTRLRRYSG